MAAVTKPATMPRKIPQVVITLRFSLRPTASSSMTTYRMEPAASARKAMDRVSLTRCWPSSVPTKVGPPPIRPSSAR
jgi:hypothetical protein